MPIGKCPLGCANWKVPIGKCPLGGADWEVPAACPVTAALQVHAMTPIKVSARGNKFVDTSHHHQINMHKP